MSKIKKTTGLLIAAAHLALWISPCVLCRASTRQAGVEGNEALSTSGQASIVETSAVPEESRAPAGVEGNDNEASSTPQQASTVETQSSAVSEESLPSTGPLDSTTAPVSQSAIASRGTTTTSTRRRTTLKDLDDGEVVMRRCCQRKKKTQWRSPLPAIPEDPAEDEDVIVRPNKRMRIRIRKTFNRDGRIETTTTVIPDRLSEHGVSDDVEKAKCITWPELWHRHEEVRTAEMEVDLFKNAPLRPWVAVPAKQQLDHFYQDVGPFAGPPVWPAWLPEDDVTYYGPNNLDVHWFFGTPVPYITFREYSSIFDPVMNNARERQGPYQNRPSDRLAAPKFGAATQQHLSRAAQGLLREIALSESLVLDEVLRRMPMERAKARGMPYDVHQIDAQTACALLVQAAGEQRKRVDRGARTVWRQWWIDYLAWFTQEYYLFHARRLRLHRMPITEAVLNTTRGKLDKRAKTADHIRFGTALSTKMSPLAPRARPLSTNMKKRGPGRAERLAQPLLNKVKKKEKAGLERKKSQAAEAATQRRRWRSQVRQEEQELQLIAREQKALAQKAIRDLADAWSKAPDFIPDAFPQLVRALESMRERARSCPSMASKYFHQFLHDINLTLKIPLGCRPVT
ncbi:unnamed protein product [Amoebophrya sp. A120]|nr:unnamed protein product [Amoebophrya sp. A120]|eukprot:GSA120T00002681001.1